MKKRAIVILFPEEEFFGTRRGCIPLFNECIQKRYLKNGYELVVVRYKGYRQSYTGGIIKIAPERIIDADITLLEQLNKYANFKNIANELTQKQYEHIVIGGFHCFDCVEKFAKEVFKCNHNVLIDTDLTEQFDFVSKYYRSWDLAKFNPELKIENNKKSFEWTSSDLIERMMERYSHPVWGVSKRYIKSLQESLDRKIFLEQFDENVT